MEVTRIQYPIGQGCFHAGHVRWKHETSRLFEDFHYVYDCGSRDGSAALQDAIVSWRSQTSRIDALFVSHLDADHVNGIDRLLASVTVDTVYIPYVDAVAPVVDILEADIDGVISASLIEARIDPRSWFGRRGVARIVRVRASPGHGRPDAEPSPLDDDELGEDSSVEDPSSRKVLFDAKSCSDLRSGGVGRPPVETMNSGEMVVVSPGQRIPWALVPHVDPAPKARRSAFYHEVRQVLGLEPYQRLRADRLAAALRDNGERGRLRNCYERIISGGSGDRHNRVSLSLYSGPAEIGQRVRWWSYVAIAHSENWPVWRLFAVPPDYLTHEQRAVGWVGTGDASLNLKNIRTAWHRSFDPFRDQIASLLLPHHGTRRSFHTSLLDWHHLTLCVASAGDPSRYGHPHRRVVHEVVSRPKVMHHVSQRPQTELPRGAPFPVTPRFGARKSATGEMSAGDMSCRTAILDRPTVALLLGIAG